MFQSKSHCFQSIFLFYRCKENKISIGNDRKCRLECVESFVFFCVQRCSFFFFLVFITLRVKNQLRATIQYLLKSHIESTKLFSIVLYLLNCNIDRYEAILMFVFRQMVFFFFLFVGFFFSIRFFWMICLVKTIHHSSNHC
jgi:hypothetical protein